MKPQTTLWSRLATLLILLVITLPFKTGDTFLQCNNKAHGMNFKKTHKEKMNSGMSDFAFPLATPRAKDKQKGNEKNDYQHDLNVKTKHHPDEEKHKNHVYDYSLFRHKRRSITMLFCFTIKIFVIISYIAVLLSSYGGFAH